jgi:Mor family transcriptional regulator
MTIKDRLGEKIAATELLNEMSVIVREEIGFTDHFAEQIAAALTRGLRRRLGGQEIYIPAEDKSTRDESIRAEFNGRNRDQIMHKYGISKSRLYEIVGRS